MMRSAIAASSGVCDTKNSCGVAADAQHFSFHSHEHPLALRIEWPVGLIGEERLVTTPRVLRKIQRDRARQSLVDPNAFAGTHLRDALEARAPADEEQYEPMRPKRSLPT